jgi:nucleoside-diphosphate-sugar epimerase
MTGDKTFWCGRRVLVIGCDGMLGGAVARELLASGAEVVGLIHDTPAVGAPTRDGRIHFVRGRPDNVFRLHSAMAVYEVAAVFHLPAPDAPAPERGTAAVLRAARLYARAVPVVTAQPSPRLEIARPPDGEAGREGGLSVARFGELFGPGDRSPARTVPAVALGLLGGGVPPHPADGPARDHVFVRDAARACLRTAEAAVADGPGRYQFRSGWLLTDRQMAAAVRAAYAGEPVAVPDSAAPANPFGWTPQQPLAEALEETLAWHRNCGHVGGAVPLREAA